MVLALRRKVSIKVRQPLTKILIPVLDPVTAEHIAAVKNLIMGEVNVKQVQLIEDTTGVITKRIKPNFKTLGPRYGKYMKQIAALTAEFSQERIAQIEAAPETVLDLGGERITVTPADFEITSEDMPGWLVASEGKLTVALDITVTDELEGRRRGTRIDKPHPEYPQGVGIRGDGQDTRGDRAEAVRGGGYRPLRGLHRRADPRRRGADGRKRPPERRSSNRKSTTNRCRSP